MSNKHFTVHLEIDYYDDPEGDKEREKAIKLNYKLVPMGSFWRYSVSHVRDFNNVTLNTQSALQIEKDSLKELIKDLFNRLPRFLDENGLCCK